MKPFYSFFKEGPLNHIFFHNDVDGIISASLFLNYNMMTDYHDSILYPVQSTMRGGTMQRIINKITDGEIAILDFEHNAKAHMWFDHHFDAEFGPNPIKNGRIFYNPSAKSAVRIIYDHYNFDDSVKELIDMVDIIDSASYPDIRFVFESTHPLMVLRAYLETMFPSDMAYSRIVDVIASHGCNVEEAIQRLRIDADSVKSINALAKKVQRDMTVFGRCSVVNQSRSGQYPRYAEYYVKNLDYAIRISTSGPNQKYIQIGHNSWCGRGNTINLGKLLKSIPYVKGGGHFNVAAGMINNADEQRFLDDIDIQINGGEMEKYGVDKDDKVESRAQELVKTGMDISDARKQSQEEMEKTANDPKVELRS